MTDATLAPIRVLVVDDEPLARLRLVDLLRREPDVTITGEAATGEEAVARIRADAPQLVFLDVQMPGMTGLDVVRTIGADAMPATIFVTAHDQYALAAFDVAAIDYLVKPFDDERFETAFRRARSRLALEGMALLRARLLAALRGGEAMPAPTRTLATNAATGATGAAPATPATPATPAYAERIAVEVRGRVRPVAVADIDYIVASGVYAELHASGQRYLIRESMQALEARLDPALFMRVHRSVIVRLARVELLHRAPGGDYEVQLRGGTRLKVSRSRREALERWMGITS